MGPWSGIFNTDFIYDIFITAIPALICITIHELSHGFVAYRLGDNTAKNMGRLTLNPIKHIDILGLAMIFIIGFGWAKPVPVNMQNFKNPKSGMALTALAGPLSNLMLAAFTLFIFLLLPAPYGGYFHFTWAFYPNPSELAEFGIQMPIITLMLHRLILINIFLAIFNLIPIPPLDGSKIVFSLLPEDLYYKVLRYERYGMIILMVLILSSRFTNIDILGTIITQPAITVLNFMVNIATNILRITV